MLLRESVIDKYNTATTSTSSVILRGFAGQSITNERLALIDIQIMETSAQVTAIVISDCYLIYNVIIDRDFLEQEHIVTIKKDNVLSFRTLSTM